MATLPLGRISATEEVAAAVPYLASDEAASLVGTDLVIDSGASLRAGRPLAGQDGHCGDLSGGSVSCCAAAVTHSGMTTARRLPPLCSIAAICALGGSALLMTGCSGTSTGSSVAEAAAASPTSTVSPSPSMSLTQDQAGRRDLLSKTKITWETAAGTAVKEVSGGKLVAIELKGTSHEAMSPSTGSPSAATPNPAPSAGAPEWQARVASADGMVRRIDIDAANGKIFRSQAEPDQDTDARRKIADRLKKATQTPAQAARTAGDKTKGKVTAVSLDENDKKLIWSVDVVSTDKWNKTTYDIDAAKGTVVREHTDHD